MTVITNLFSSLDAVIPGLGTAIVEWLWGGYSVSGTTLNRFFSLHYLLPFVIVGLVILHIWALHVVGQNNPTGLDIKTKSDTVPMYPYAVAKDAFALFVFCIVFAWFVFFLPDYLGHADNYIEANPLVTPPHIVPEWYFLPFYAILRAIPDKLGGVIAMFASIAILAFVPWLDTPPRPLGQVPADLQVVLLAVRVLLPGARLSRLEARRRRLRVLGADLHRLLLRPLPDRDADRRHYGDASKTCRARSLRRCSARRASGAGGQCRRAEAQLAKARGTRP